MPTEDDARTLLAKAAATIDVDDSTPMTLTGLPEPHHRRWPILAAAAAVVVAIGGGYLVAELGGDDPAPAPAFVEGGSASSPTDQPSAPGDETITTDELEGSLNRMSSATQFVAWARGEGRAPTFAPSVRMLLFGSEWTQIDKPERRSAWLVKCPRFMSAPCPEGAVEAFQESVGKVALSTTRARGCGARPGLSPDDLIAAASTDLVRIDERGTEDCEEHWSVELWIDEAGVIYAVNATVPRL